jgi:hypothetical protein
LEEERGCFQHVNGDGHDRLDKLLFRSGGRLNILAALDLLCGVLARLTVLLFIQGSLSPDWLMDY